ncbi:hypothetical protein ACFLX4_01075 [Chloroflexota bacterium]
MHQFFNRIMDSIIKTLRFMLSVLLNIYSTLCWTASYSLASIGYGEHNIAMFGKGVGFYTDRAGGCQYQFLGMAELKQDKYDSHAQIRTLYGNRGKSLTLVVP